MSTYAGTDVDKQNAKRRGAMKFIKYGIGIAGLDTTADAI
jgi:hypothetical protein